jgi:hypothetical protein
LSQSNEIPTALKHPWANQITLAFIAIEGTAATTDDAMEAVRAMPFSHKANNLIEPINR